MALRKGAVADELDFLRRRNAELELKLRMQLPDVAGAVDTESDNSRPADSPADGSLKPRGPRQHFKIRRWESERMERSSKGAPADDTTTLVPFKAETETSLVAAAFPASGQVASQVSAISWIMQPKLLQAIGHCGGSSSSAHDQFLGIQAELGTASVDDLTSKVMDIFAKHLQDFEQPHLGFSAAIPPLNSILREADKATAPSFAEGDAFFRCACVVRCLMKSSRFGATPPRRRPDDITRPAYVRELCAQVGLCLDLARLGFAHKKHLKTKKRALKENNTENSQPEEVVQQPMFPFHSMPPHLRSAEPELDMSQRSSSQADSTQSESAGDGAMRELSACVDHQELRECLTRAGKYLAAVQMDIDRHHDEVAAQVMRANRAKDDRLLSDFAELQDPQGVPDAVESAPGPADEPTPASLLAPDEAPLPIEDAVSGTIKNEEEAFYFPKGEDQTRKLVQKSSEPCEAKERKLVRNVSKSEEVLSPFPAIAAIGGCEDERTVEASVPEDSGNAPRASPAANAVSRPAVNALLTPTFGEFLMQQLLPLYIADVPFETLRHLAERYCGIPLDSDDEEKAWKVLGLPMPQQAAPRKARRVLSRQPSLAASVASSASMVPMSVSSAASQTPSETSPSLAALCEVMNNAKGPPLMRQQMHTSIVEKRRKEFKAPRNMEIDTFKRPGPQRTPSPIIKPAACFSQSPAASVGEFSVARRFGTPPPPAPSPQSMRKNSRGRLQIEASMKSVISSCPTPQGMHASSRSRSPRLPKQKPKQNPQTPQIRASPLPPRTPCLNLNWALMDTPAR